jgi:16S rRNA (cytosine967-C5)-methyltransferase
VSSAGGRPPSAARLLALRVLERVAARGAFADLALHAALARSRLPPRERAFATELVYGTLRWQGRLDWALARCLGREPASLERPVCLVLRLGAYQLLCERGVPARAAVDESVRCLRALGLERATGLANAALRRLARERADLGLPELERDPLGHLVHALSLPPWIAERWLALFGAQDAAALARASNAPPPLAVRANRLRGDRVALLAELRERFPEAAPGRLAPDAVVVGRRGDLARDPAFREGRCTVQDEAAQLVVELLDPRPGERVLDLCAAPGGKAGAAAERVGPPGQVVGLDRSRRRLRLLAREARRLGLAWLLACAADASRPLPLAPGGFDRVLVDAPCSGLGVLRRNPDQRWRLSPGDPARLARVQAALLAHGALALRRGGTLVYSTCTVLPEENEGVVREFLRRTPGFRQLARGELPEGLRGLADPEGWVRTRPDLHDADGFVSARLVRLG